MKTRVRLKPSDIEIVGRLRPDIDQATVDALVVSIEKIGLQNPISVYFVDDFEIDGELVDHVPILAAGMHRLEAIKKIGMDLIECDVFDTQREARMWEISENLHRNDLDRIQRAQHEAEWIKLREEEEDKMGQVGPFSKVGAGRGNEGGIRLAARELPVPGDSEEAKRHRLRRDMAIASAGDEPLEEARKAGLANNERALLEVARAPEDQRVAKVHEIAERKAAGSSGIDAELKIEAAKNMARWLSERSDASQWEWIKSTLYTAGAKAVADAFVNETGAGAPVMDKRWV